MKRDIDNIILGYLRRELTSEEEKRLDSWLEEDPSHREQLDLISEIWNVPLNYPKLVNIDDEEKKIWSRLQGGNKHIDLVRKRPAIVTKYLLKAAAALVFFIGLGYFFWYSQNKEEGQTPTLVKEIKRINPPGQKSRIHLPDGSIVVLNASSQLSYRNDFNSKSRKIHLKGEAYFEVAKNPDIPFEVYTDDLVITAIGTSFNVNAFENKQTEKVALNTGKVKIECLDGKIGCELCYLNPRELAVYNQKTGKVNVLKYKDMDPFGWKEGKIIFHHATFEEVIEVLARWYNVEFEIHGTLKHEWDYSSTFENEVLKNILRSLKFSEKIDYKINGSKIEINL